MVCSLESTSLPISKLDFTQFEIHCKCQRNYSLSQRSHYLLDCQFGLKEVSLRESGATHTETEHLPHQVHH